MATSFRCRPEMGSDDFSYIRGDLLLIRDGLLRGLNDILNLLVAINTEVCKILGTFMHQSIPAVPIPPPGPTPGH